MDAGAGLALTVKLALPPSVMPAPPAMLTAMVCRSAASSSVTCTLSVAVVPRV